MSTTEEKAKKAKLSSNLCPDCIADPEIKCPRNKDGKCLECGAELCAYHLMKHFRKDHCISIEWRGIQ